jgi:hypothetical protein
VFSPETVSSHAPEEQCPLFDDYNPQPGIIEGATFFYWKLTKGM